MDLESKTAPAEELLRWVEQSRGLTLALIEDLSNEQLLGKLAATVNPMIWHVGHISWFQEKWVLRHLGGLPPLRPDVDALYDSFEVAHEIRWELDMPGREGTASYALEVMENVLERIAGQTPGEADTYFNRLSVFHEDMHNEAMIYDRQTQGLPEPPLLRESRGAVTPMEGGGALPGDVEVRGDDAFLLGGSRDMPYVFDNEKWAHPVKVAAFRISRAPVTNGEFAGFVEAGGYENPGHWSIAGQLWLRKSRARRPLYWRKAGGGGWRIRSYDGHAPLAEHHPVIHVSWYEAEAYCNWAGRRLPSEAEWELAAATAPAAGGGLEAGKRRFPWGDQAPTPGHANLDRAVGGTLPVSALPEGDSGHGCRQMLGNIWEWTGDGFYPFPGFVVDPYKEYSAPWFGYQKVLKGGSWATRGRMVRNTWRNFFMPNRCDIFAGFRTCAL